MIEIKQDSKISLIQDVKSIEWLIDNTEVSIFDPVNFTGYQRKIDDKHIKKIVEYLKGDSVVMPTSIICATDAEYTLSSKLRIVDGQHRIAAFKELREKYPSRYEKIKKYEISILVMQKVDQKLEIDTFITINKTSKKVDTSLALVLKNKITNYDTSDDLTKTKRDYLAVEIASRLNENQEPDNIWFNKILYEGSTKDSSSLITLNAFVRPTRTLLLYLHRNDILDFKWDNEEEINSLINKVIEIINAIWKSVNIHWIKKLNNDIDSKRIIQGPIGYTSITKAIILIILHESKQRTISFEELLIEIPVWIKKINIQVTNWASGGKYSKFSSESGYTFIAEELVDVWASNL